MSGHSSKICPKKGPKGPFLGQILYAFELHAVCKTYFGTFKTMFQLTHRLLVPCVQMRSQQNGQNGVKIGQIGVKLSKWVKFWLKWVQMGPNGSAWAKMGRNRVKMGQHWVKIG